MTAGPLAAAGIDEEIVEALVGFFVHQLGRRLRELEEERSRAR